MAIICCYLLSTVLFSKLATYLELKRTGKLFGINNVSKVLDSGDWFCGVMQLSPGQPAEGIWSLHHVKGDLFSGPEDEALAHCISKDYHMGAGIAVMFKKKFGGVAELKEQSELFCIM